MPGIVGETIKSPVKSYGSVESASGISTFISNIITIIFAAAGLFAFFNLMIAGFSYITAGGDTKKIEAATASINLSLIGLVVMVGAAAITGIVSYLLFGSATAILSPSITGPGSFN
jgi:hypothetical protein